jgi:hypothetical protein
LKPHQDTEGVQLGGADHINHILRAKVIDEPGTSSELHGSMSLNDKGYGMTAPLRVWHERNRHLPMDKLRQIHDHNAQILKNRHELDLKQRNKSTSECGHDIDSGQGSKAAAAQEEAVTEPMTHRMVSGVALRNILKQWMCTCGTQD